jgi:predicted RNA-binding Zn-ribbon protein involved in translation (DUF1610 family)
MAQNSLDILHSRLIQSLTNTKDHYPQHLASSTFTEQPVYLPLHCDPFYTEHRRGSVEIPKMLHFQRRNSLPLVSKNTHRISYTNGNLVNGINFVMESGSLKPKAIKRCSRCQKTGHNYRTCTQNPLMPKKWSSNGNICPNNKKVHFSFSKPCGKSQLSIRASIYRKSGNTYRSMTR